MSRAIPEWIGATPDTPAPSRVKLRVFFKHNGICPKCSRRLRPKHWDTDHIMALVNGGENREGNLQPLCDVPCHKNKTREDVAEKSYNYKVRLRNAGIKRKPKGRPLLGTKASGIRHRMNGDVERW